MNLRIVTKKETLKSIINIWTNDPSKHIVMRHSNFSLSFFCDEDMSLDYSLGFQKDAFNYFKIQHQVPETPFVFVAMPFEETNDSQKIFEIGIKEIVEQFGYKCIRLDKNYLSLPITDKIFSHILNCQFVIADLSGFNPNVFYELGLAHSLNKKVIQISQKHFENDMPIDVSNIFTILYSTNELKKLKEDIKRSIMEHIELSKSDLG